MLTLPGQLSAMGYNRSSLFLFNLDIMKGCELLGVGVRNDGI
jgi:hypothetical protein